MVYFYMYISNENRQERKGILTPFYLFCRFFAVHLPQISHTADNLFLRCSNYIRVSVLSGHSRVV